MTIDNVLYIEFAVIDTGIGIKKEDHIHLFKLFSMISTKQKINPNGCGIGLTVSKRYLEHLGGTIQLESEYGVGTTVKFTIPIRPFERKVSNVSINESKHSDSSISLD